MSIYISKQPHSFINETFSYFKCLTGTATCILVTDFNSTQKMCHERKLELTLTWQSRISFYALLNTVWTLTRKQCDKLKESKFCNRKLTNGKCVTCVWITEQRVSLLKPRFERISQNSPAIISEDAPETKRLLE